MDMENARPELLPVEYQTQTDAWAVPTGGGYEGRAVLAYNSTYDETRMYRYINGGWKSVELLG